MNKTRTIEFEELVACVGDKNALKLCKYFGGLRVPSALNVLRARRDAAMLKDWLAGAQIAELSAKYDIDKSIIKKKVNQLLRSQIGASVG